MTRQYIENLFQKISFILHFPVKGKSYLFEVMIILILNKSQEIAIGSEITQKSHPEMNFLKQFIDYSFAVDLQSLDLMVVSILMLFLVHILSIIFLLQNSWQKDCKLIQNIPLHYYLFYYPSFVYIPAIYLNLKYIVNEKTVRLSYVVCLASINILISLTIKVIHIYFARSDHLIENTNILQQTYSFPRNLINETILLLSILLKTIGIPQAVQFALIIGKQMCIILSYLYEREENSKIFLFTEAISIVSLIALNGQFSICDYLILITLIPGFLSSLFDRLTDNYTIIIEQNSLKILKIIQLALNQRRKEKSKFILQAIINVHKCSSCKHYSQLTQCIFRKIVLENLTKWNKDKITVMYCNFFSETGQLPALIQLSALVPSSVYYQCSVRILIYQFANKIKQLQLDIEKSNQPESLKDKQFQLNPVIIFSLWHISSELFPMMKKTIASQITFWSSLIKGFSDIKGCQIQVLKTTEQMMLCKQNIESKFILSTYHLKESKTIEIVGLRVLQVFYSSVYANFYHSFQLQKEIETLLKQQISTQDEPFSGLKLAQEKIYIFQTGIKNSRGNFFNLNYRRLSHFLGVNEKEASQISKIYHITPTFISLIHERLIDNYIETGYTTLPLQNNSSFFLNLEGYIEPCFLSLFNFYNHNQEDFLMNLIMSKDQSTTQVIIFDSDGKIQGMTKQFYEDMIKSNLALLSRNQCENIQISTSIQKFLSLQPLIQFYFTNIETNIEKLYQQYTTTQSYYLTGLKSIFVIPINHGQCLAHSLNILKYFKEENDNKKESFEKDISNTNQKSGQTIGTNQCLIDNIKIQIMLKQLRDKINNLVDFGDVKESQFQNEIQYTLQFKSFGNRNIQYGYFILFLDDYKSQFETKIRSGKTEHNIINKKLFQKDFTVKINSETLKIDQLEFARKEQDNQILTGYQTLEQLNQNQQLLSNREINSNQNSLFLPMIKKPGQQQHFIFEQIIEEYDIKQEDINFYHHINDKNKNSDFQQKQQLRQENENLNIASINSRSSVGSISIEAIKIMEQISHSKNQIIPLRKITIILSFFEASILFYLIFCVVLIENQINSYTSAVTSLAKPQNIVYFYSSVFYQMWSMNLDTQNIFMLSEFQKDLNINELTKMILNGKQYIQKDGIAVSLAVQEQGIHTFNMNFYQEDKMSTINQNLEDFYLLLYQITGSMYRDNYGLNTQYYQPLIANGFCRQNILQMMDLHNQIMAQLVSSTIKQAAQFRLTMSNQTIVGIIIVLLFLSFQIKYWVFIDKIQKNIILLVSRFDEAQAKDQIQKLNRIYEILNDYEKQNWQLINFYETLQSTSLNNTIENKKTQSSLTHNSQKNYLYSRIRNTSLLTLSNFVITLCILFLLSGYMIIGSLIATLEFSQYRIKMDSIGYIGGIVKTENLIEGNNMALINETYALSLLLEYKNDLSPLLNEISSTILTNALNTNGISRFDSILNDDICSFVTMLSCNPSLQTLSYSSKDDISNIVKNGILGYTASLIKYLDSDYDYEFQYLKYNSPQENRMAIQSQSFENYFLSYFCDVQDTTLAFLNLFKVDNTEIANSIISLIKAYYIGFGLILFFSIIVTTVIWIRNTSKRLQSLRQILVLLPQEQILNENISSQARLILSWLY